MNDFLEVLEPYKDIKEISNLIKETEELRKFYNSNNIEKMQSHILKLMLKYFGETIFWNSTHPVPPLTPDEQFINAEDFLYRIGIEILAKHNIKILRA